MIHVHKDKNIDCAFCVERNRRIGQLEEDQRETEEYKKEIEGLNASLEHMQDLFREAAIYYGFSEWAEQRIAALDGSPEHPTTKIPQSAGTEPPSKHL